MGHTFFLGRRRQVDDTLKLPVGQRVDDLLSAELNLGANKLDQDPDGTYRTLIVRRSRAENEGPDDVSPSGYRAELVPLRFRLTPDAATGRLNALIDITGFSSWARRNSASRACVSFTLASISSRLGGRFMAGGWVAAAGPAPSAPRRTRRSSRAWMK